MSGSFLRNSSKRCIQRLLERRSILADFSVSIETPSLTKQQWRSYTPSPLLFKKFKQSGLSPSLHSSSLSSSYSVSSSSSTSTSTSTSKNGFVGWYLGLIESRPILTKSVTSGLIYVAADLSSQKISQTPSETYNWIRTLRMCGYGMLIMGPSLHFWFNFVSKILPKRDVLTTFKKIILGQTVYGPIMTSVFFSVNAGLQGENAAEIIARLKRDLLPTFKNGLLYWPMCDFVTFKFIPVRLQPLISNSFAYLWTIYITYMASLKKPGPSCVSAD